MAKKPKRPGDGETAEQVRQALNGGHGDPVVERRLADATSPEAVMVSAHPITGGGLTAFPEDDAEGVERIHVENIGPVDAVEIPMIPGRITVLRGRNGSGKSTVLSAVGSVISGQGAGLSSRDGTVGGRVDGYGVTITVARNGANRRKGSAEVVALSDRFGLTEFVSPRVKDPAAADAVRVKALASLLGVKITREQVAAVLRVPAAEVDQVVSPDSLSREDPVECLDRVKRDLEFRARQWEQEADKLAGQVREKRAAAGSTRPDLPTREAAESAVRAAAVEAGRLAAAREAWERNVPAWEAAEALLETLKTSRDLKTVEEEQERTLGKLQALEREEEELRARIRTVEANKISVASRLNELTRELEAAEHREESRKSAEAALASRGVPPTQEAVDVAEAAVAEAQETLAAVLSAERARGLAEEAAKLEARERDHRSQAARWREAAAGVFQLLGSPINQRAADLTVDAEGRLIRKGHARGSVYFGELSPGERWRDAIRLAVGVFTAEGVPGAVVIDQEAWEALDAENRRIVREAVAESDVAMVTAEASREQDGPELRADVLE